VARATEDLVRQPKLLQIGQPLELPRVVELGGQRRQIKVFVHRVVEVLRTPTRACSAATAVRSFGAAQQRGAFVHCAALTGGRSCHLPLVASLGSPQRHKHEPPQPRAGQSCCLLHPWNHRSSHWRSTYLAVPPRQASVCFCNRRRHHCVHRSVQSLRSAEEVVIIRLTPHALLRPQHVCQVEHDGLLHSRGCATGLACLSI